MSTQTLDVFTENVATHVLDQQLPHPRSNDQPSYSPGFHNQGHRDDLYFVLEEEINYRCTWAPINHSLVFIAEPSPSLQYQYPLVSRLHTPNREPYALDPRNTANAPYLENESRLYEILRTLERRPVLDVWDRLFTRVYEGLAMMERHKELEWNRQRTGSVARRHGYGVVDTGT